jgi:enterochelin esterase-like enzyme
MRRRLVTNVAAAWLIFCAYGVWSYAHDYYVYRGFGPPHDPPGVRAGTLTHEQFSSPALGGRRSYEIYLPPGYSAAAAHGQRFGVLYALHGSPARPQLFFDVAGAGVALDTLVARHAVKPLLIVIPDGRDGSFKSDTQWADTPHGRYESFVLDVVDAVDRRWPTVADRAHRVLAGYSAGAYAAANITLRHLSTFAAFEAWSGYFRQTADGVFKHASAAQLRANSPAIRVTGMRASIARLPLAAYLYGGAQDPDTRQLAPFASALRSAGATVTTDVRRGRHDWQLWRDRTPAMLTWAAAQIEAAR